MKITDALLGEHGVFYAQFQLMAKSIDGADLEVIETLGAMLASALAPHAQIENDILFPAIEQMMGEGGPTHVMRMEHELIEGKLKELEELKEAHEEIEGALARLPATSSADEARRLVRDVIGAAREHFTKEEHILFPMAAQMLDERTLTRLGDEWAERRSVVLG
jgi:hemerythrin-like domain-containing protein